MKKPEPNLTTSGSLKMSKDKSSRLFAIYATVAVALTALNAWASWREGLQRFAHLYPGEPVSSGIAYARGGVVTAIAIPAAFACLVFVSKRRSPAMFLTLYSVMTLTLAVISLRPQSGL